MATSPVNAAGARPVRCRSKGRSVPGGAAPLAPADSGYGGRDGSVEAVQHGREVFRKRALEARPGAIGVRETEPRRMQEMARQPRQLWTAVPRISGERMSDEREMRADLVQDAGCDLDFDEREAGTPLYW